MASTAQSPPPISPHEEPENHNQQPPITSPPPQASVPSPPLPMEYVDHVQEFTNSISPSSPPQLPENSADHLQHPPPDDFEGQQEPPVPPSPSPEVTSGHLRPLAPPSPPPTGTEQQTENFSPNHEPPVSQLPTSPSPSPSPSSLPIGVEEPVESTDYAINPNPTSDHESPISKQPPVKSRNFPTPGPNLDHESPSPSSPAKFEENPKFCENPSPNLDHESPSPSSPTKFEENPNIYENPNPNLDHESPAPSSPAKLNENPSAKANQSPKDPSPSPPLTTGSPASPQDTLEPNSTLTPPLGVPILHAAACSSLSKPQSSPWTPQETANLIQAYQEKWYSLKKGPLKAGQWEEVAITVAARCGYEEPTKTSKQCRHKLEKLRKRYRAERGKPRSKANAWNFFKLMDNLEKGPLPISSSQPMALVEYQKPSSSNGKKRKNYKDNDDIEEDDDGDHEFLVGKRSSRSKNHNHLAINGYLTGNLGFSDGGNRVVRGLRTPVVHKRREVYQEDDAGDDEEEEEEAGGENGGEEEGVAAQLAVEIKGFAEKFVKMENKKIEMIRDVERYRLEMENKRMEMILESQQMLVETVNKAFSSCHKTHRLSAN